MRLEQKEVNAIIQALNLYIHEKSELRLYGSRVRDDLKGGDIDLLLLIEDQQLAQKLLSEKHYVLSEIKKNILNASSDNDSFVCPVGVGSSVSFVNITDGERTVLSCVGGKIASTSASRPGNSVDLTSQNEVVVTDCNNFVQCDTDENDKVIALEVKFNLAAGTTQPDYYERIFNSQIGIRN